MKENEKRPCNDENDVKDSRSNGRHSGRSGRKGKNRRPKSGSKPNSLKLEKRSNNPAWYYSDERLADQVSQLSFQNLAGYPIDFDNRNFDVPNVVRIFMNPSPGVQLSSNYNSSLSQNSAINMSGFKLYSKLAAFTGRAQNYAPQDISTMILGFGELISMFEFIRRAFGIAYTMNMRNRDYPRQVLNFGMAIDADDLFTNYSDYRTRFNALVTLVNQLPIPKNIAYFDKCASIYEKVFLDSPSSMAQTLVPIPFSTWLMDEQSYSGGTILSTYEWCTNGGGSVPSTPNNMAYYLNKLSTMVSAMLNSSSLHTVYTDILNLASKTSMDFWKMDYLFEGYQVIPEYDINFLLQMHNCTITGLPYSEPTFVSTPIAVTPYNDVYPDPNRNCVFYNPAFPILNNIPSGMPRTGKDVLIDMMTDQVSLTDRVEVTRYSSSNLGTPYVSSTSVNCYVDTVLPDHYVCLVEFSSQTSSLVHHLMNGSVQPDSSFPDLITQLSNIDWAPRIWEWDTNAGTYTGRYSGDINFYTVVDTNYLRKLHDFCGLALYDVR